MSGEQYQNTFNVSYYTVLSICTNVPSLKISDIFLPISFYSISSGGEWMPSTVYYKINYLLVSLAYISQKKILTSPLYSMQVTVLCNKEPEVKRYRRISSILTHFSGKS